MLGRRGTESRNPICKENLTMTFEPVSVIQNNVGSSTAQLRPEGCRWRSRRECERPGVPVLFWPHRSGSQTTPSCFSSLTEGGRMVETLNQPPHKLIKTHGEIWSGLFTCSEWRRLLSSIAGSTLGLMVKRFSAMLVSKSTYMLQINDGVTFVNTAT